jgi:hypothetical protein
MNVFRRIFVAALPAGAALLATSVASADAGPKFSDSLWLPLGLNLGYSLQPEPVPNGFVFGPEASFVYLDRSAYWLGAYADALHDFGPKNTRIGLGAEAGVAIFGLDAGYVRTVGDDPADGFRARLLISFAALHFYGGVGHTFGEPDRGTYGEIGALIKFPILLWEGGSNRHRPRYPAPESHRPEPEHPRLPHEPAPGPPPDEQPAYVPGPPQFAEPPPGPPPAEPAP